MDYHSFTRWTNAFWKSHDVTTMIEMATSHGGKFCFFTQEWNMEIGGLVGGEINNEVQVGFENKT
jgi:hypothetical protein